ncbi:hypothetical protein TWF788_009625 [Orbilia oligospora]|uniref:Uncharacterized protein n=1 Tax=Orbilia oligospora TaxID=2813651 RepID=A0A7C8PB10_ORBOL|nr:hypothetical protein TWF788_009625 [Orbilia oligospora]KAF3231651.1 hypothetical protein TWF191_005714 [Orbilia oligospora]
MQGQKLLEDSGVFGSLQEDSHSQWPIDDTRLHLKARKDEIEEFDSAHEVGSVTQEEKREKT